jgi:hypothetical protein
MLRFCGFGLELFVSEVLTRRCDDPIVCSATDDAGRWWLIVEAVHKDAQMIWVCAPASPRMVELVGSGRASATDAVRHSLTGWVEIVSTIDGRSVPEQRVACSRLSEFGAMGVPEAV